MSQAQDMIIISNSTQPIIVTSLKKILRFISNSDVILTFDDNSQVRFVRTDSWRTDRLEVINEV